MGGYGAPFDTKVRDVGCALCFGAGFIVLHLYTWYLFASVVVMFAALTTYWKKSGPVRYYHWYATGFVYSLAALPAAYSLDLVFGWMYYSMAVVAGVVLWSVFVKIAWLEEFGRGAIIVGALPILRWL